MENLEIARMLWETGDLMEIAGEDGFRIRSYRNAASAIEGARRKRLGALPGWPDLGVFWRERVALIELKRERFGVLSPAQRGLHRRLADAGFRVAVCRTVVEALDAVSARGIPLRGRVAA